MSQTRKTVIFGTGKVGEVVHYYLTEHPDYEVAAFTADAEYVDEAELLSTPVIPFEDVEAEYPPDQYRMFTAVAYSEGNQTRTTKFREGKRKGYEFITFVHPGATVADNVTLGENCFVFEENVIQPFVDIGDNCILWSGNHIGHHSTIERNCFISSHVVVSGNVVVGRNSFLGVNSTLVDDIELGDHSVVGAGAVLVEDIEGSAVYAGQPAKKVKEINS